MGFYLRKGFNFGPLRLNLSRSGLGASFGVKGARIGVGPRGTYVHAGRGGLYYRQNLTSGLHPSGGTSTPLPIPVRLADALQDIESADTSQLVDSSSTQLLQELNRVQTRTQALPIAVVCSLLILVVMMAARSPGWSYAVAAAILVVASLYARHLDVTQGTAILRFDLDPDAEASFSKLRVGFGKFSSCAAIWHIQASGKTEDWKRNAGATGLVRRQAIRPLLSKPPRVECNLEVPTLPAGVQTLYLFPDRILVYDRSGVGSVDYRDLVVETGPTRFIEEEAVPSDARVVDQTWKFVNKKGGPDRRFSNNREMPIVLYGVVHLTSPSGLNEMYNCSSADNGAAFAASVPRPTQT